MSESFDIVFMWVDDSTPGYGELLARYAENTHDRNPNRTRDNLQLLRYALRAIERYAPWRRNVYLATCRPQCPAWLKRDHPELRVVHHDEFIPAEFLPTFNSFAIQSFLHRLPGLSQRFVSFDDDMLLLKPTAISDFVSEDGHIRYHFKGHLPRGKVDSRTSPWNAALANNARLLDELGREKIHRGFAHGPKMFDIADIQDIESHWPGAFRRTRAARFRGHDNIALEALLPDYLVEQGRAAAIPAEETSRRTAYLGLENVALWNRFQLWRLAQREPAYLTLNDNFGPNPRASAEAAVRQFLQRSFPQPSRFEVIG